MKFTNVKQLIIKFMGGGLINFPTRFLRWVKINGDSDDGSDDSGDGGGGGNLDNLMQAFADFDMYIKSEAAAFMASDGENLDYGAKTSFGEGYIPTENAVSVPITNYFYISDLNVLKLLASLCYGQSAHLTSQTKSDHLIGDNSQKRSYGFNIVQDWTKPYPQPVEGIALSILESGSASASYPNPFLFIDPNDYTKCLVEPEDL